MSFRRCPGSSSFAKPKIEMVRCPQCAGDVEIWSDEADGQCPSCGKFVIRTATQSCVDWCRHAKDCLGDEKYRKYGEMKLSMRKEALLRAMEDRTGKDASRRPILQAVIAAADLILREEPAADPNVVIAAAVLRAAEPPGQPSDDGASTRQFLAELNYPEGFINEVLYILGAKSVDASSPLNARVFHDTLLLGLCPAAARPDPAAFLTDSGRRATHDTPQPPAG